mgnify:FL=1
MRICAKRVSVPRRDIGLYGRHHVRLSSVFITCTDVTTMSEPPEPEKTRSIEKATEHTHPTGQRDSRSNSTCSSVSDGRSSLHADFLGEPATDPRAEEPDEASEPK